MLTASNKPGVLYLPSKRGIPAIIKRYNICFFLWFTTILIDFLLFLDDYDINFSNTTADNFIDLGPIDINLKELTFSAWVNFKPVPVYKKYPLLSYVSDNSTNLFVLAFGGVPLSKFQVKLLGQSAT